MSLEKTVIDSRSKQLLTFERTSVTADSYGNPVVSYDLITTEYGDIQPYDRSPKIDEAELASTAYTGDRTHLCFIENRISGVVAKDFVKDEAGNRYVIVFVVDWLNAPQYFFLQTSTYAG